MAKLRQAPHLFCPVLDELNADADWCSANLHFVRSIGCCNSGKSDWRIPVYFSLFLGPRVLEGF